MAPWARPRLCPMSCSPQRGTSSPTTETSSPSTSACPARSPCLSSSVSLLFKVLPPGVSYEVVEHRGVVALHDQSSVGSTVISRHWPHDCPRVKCATGRTLRVTGSAPAQFHYPVLDAGIGHVHIKPATPRLNGKVERPH